MSTIRRGTAARLGLRRPPTPPPLPPELRAALDVLVEQWEAATRDLGRAFAAMFGHEPS